jgi:predicted outer membrane lipoprotein
MAKISETPFRIYVKNADYATSYLVVTSLVVGVLAFGVSKGFKLKNSTSAIIGISTATAFGISNAMYGFLVFTEKRK